MSELFRHICRGANKSCSHPLQRDKYITGNSNQHLNTLKPNKREQHPQLPAFQNLSEVSKATHSIWGNSKVHMEKSRKISSWTTRRRSLFQLLLAVKRQREVLGVEKLTQYQLGFIPKSNKIATSNVCALMPTALYTYPNHSHLLSIDNWCRSSQFECSFVSILLILW